jgi:hypothetical protein
VAIAWRRQRRFPLHRGASKTLATLQCPRDENSLSDLADVWEMGFKLVADAGEVGIDGVGVNTMAHIYGVKTQRVRGWVNWKLVEPAELDVGVERRAVCLRRGCVDGGAEGDSALMDELLHGPGFPHGLPGLDMGCDHDGAVPNDSCGG